MLRVLTSNHDFPIPTRAPVHSGKVRSVYWLNESDSSRLIRERGYDAHPDACLGIMIVSDRISAFECLWKGENGLSGVPGKGAALNAISYHWFEAFRQAGLANSHIVEAPHPLVWVVQRAHPIRIEAIARRYITGSLWRAYARGDREFCGLRLPDGLQRDGVLPVLLITPSTKGVLQDLDGIPEVDDVNVSRGDIERHWQAFGFRKKGDVDHYEELLRQGFEVIESALQTEGQIFVDTKFEFGYCNSAEGTPELIYMDEVGTPDSSRIWDGAAYQRGKVLENSKEGFRQALLSLAPDPNVLLDKARIQERQRFAADTLLPESLINQVSRTYVDIAETITGQPLVQPEEPRREIENLLSAELGLL